MYLTLDLDAFVRSLRIERDTPHAFFLGAGASLTSGLPTATTCVWEWKRAIFTTQNPGLEEKVSELSLPSVRDRIQRWLSHNGHTPAEGEDEYGYYIEKCLPIADTRRGYFAELVRKARPYVGYDLMCLLAEAGVIGSVWTTNFDGLVARAAGRFNITPIEVGIDCAERLYRLPRRNELICASLHGDYRYDALKNTPQELKVQDSKLRAALVETLTATSLVVMGYSGRDRSVMDALYGSLEDANARGKIFWCGHRDEPEDPVSEFLIAAGTRGRDAYYVPASSFDDTLIRLSLHCLEGEGLRQAKSIIGEQAELALPRAAPFAVSNGTPTSLIKSNAWPVKLPAEVFQFDLIEWPHEKVWKWLAEKALGRDLIAVPFREVLALGTIDEIQDAFAGNIRGQIQRVPITDEELKCEDGAVTNLMRRALVRSIASRCLLQTDGNWQVWDPAISRREQGRDKYFNVHDAACISLRRVATDTFMVLEPTIYIDGDPAIDSEEMRNIRLRVLGYQHNKEYNSDLNRWKDRILTRNQVSTFDFPPKSASFKFEVQSAPTFVSVVQSGKRPIVFPPNVVKLVRYRGLEVREPRLILAGERGIRGNDTMPLRGLAQHGPFDLDKEGRLLESRVSIAVLCPKLESRMLYEFLLSGTQRQSPTRGSKEDYLVPYPGFEAAFRVPLSIPTTSEIGWYTLPEIPSQASPKSGSLALAHSIKDGLTSLAATGNRLAIILTPTRWNAWRGFEDESESFDVHDWVKAFSIRQGIATQFLDQDTFKYSDQCRVWWWLSLALYAKAMRTPFALDGVDPGTAFVGLGYSVKRLAEPGKRIVLGCSHIYNSQGQGLQFRLSQIENAVFIGRNPFMTFEDARKLGDTIRTLFWETHSRLPDRVVIHKLTQFRPDEQKGLVAGLDGVAHVELIEINHEAALRFISSTSTASGFGDAMFPVRRGTTVRLSDHEALLWIHGSTDAVKPNWTYFQGKRRIPGPVVIRRYAGRSDLATIASEMLGLSKMDWNSGDLYSPLPATVESSRRIARIGSLLERFGDRSYDYRLFM